MEVVSLWVGDAAEMDDVKVLCRRDAAPPLGGVKMSCPRVSWPTPSTAAARWAAAGLRKLSVPRTAPGGEGGREVGKKMKFNMRSKLKLEGRISNHKKKKKEAH